ncbi:MAG: response regulator transcription factor [Candidatus Zixiibacteriota bacterium]
MAKIAIIDDDQDFREIISSALMAGGHEIVEAESGKEGYELINAENPDLAIVDLMMETNDAGFILCHKVKKNPDLKDIPLIMLTAVTSETGYKFGIDTPEGKKWIGADAYLDKPVPTEELVERVRQLLKR